ncbi:hypothetical protein EZS27_035079 [termite gut metagenome]|uniref:Uncharacterized protein n=1 Tax=termite gut metagenome TaxID=433724 RepID=A0A5J4PXN5_9ZZZZ
MNIKSGLDIDVSRNSFNNSADIEELQYAIYRAVHIAVCIESDLDENKKNSFKIIYRKFLFQENEVLQIIDIRN